MTLLLGYLTAYENYRFLKNENSEAREAIEYFVETQKSRLLFWSESATPAFLSVVWFLERHNRQLEAEQVILSIVEAIVTLNGPASKASGLADPFHSIEDVLRRYLSVGQDGLDDISQEDFEGHSYSLRSLVEWLARRLRRQSLAHLWEEITRLCYSEFIPEPLWATYLWYSDKGNSIIAFPESPKAGKIF